jgi:acyl-CoA thioester hydrolase
MQHFGVTLRARTGKVDAAPGEDKEPGFTVEVAVRFRDLDARGHVNNAVYLTYFEIARLAMWTELTGSLNLQEREMIVAEITCTYKSPALFNELLDITVIPVAIRRSSFILRYRITERTSGRLIATGRGAHVAYDYATSQPTPVWPELRAGLEALAGRPLGPDEE